MGEQSEYKEPSVPNPMAVEEWKQLQTIIGRFDGLEFQIRGWLLLLLAGLITALFSNSNKLKPQVFLVIGLVVVAVFCFMELTTRVPKRMAIRRAIVVERSIREGRIYDGPAIAETLTNGPRTTLRQIFREFFIVNAFAFYVPLFVVIWIIAIKAA